MLCNFEKNKATRRPSVRAEVICSNGNIGIVSSKHAHKDEAFIFMDQAKYLELPKPQMEGAHSLL